MKISEIMTTDVKTTTGTNSIREAAMIMAEIDTGAVLVQENERLIGMITDRDITVRAVAQELDSNTPVREVMSDNIRYCFDDDEVEVVASNMAGLEMRRLPVLNSDKRLVGVVSLGNIAASGDQDSESTLLEGVAKPH
ncbi:MAG: CBS domain-containing protein [Halopseudomonas sp.]|uniref:CBS domain-containing protein n=1 Tax=Halopseudomonas sp. TaxID=2901191 RepID=UPI0030021005